ncbi:MAG: NAD-binding protein [Methanotrichaceae archaeon]|nr:NAD-binding protein [Methanotrichaceae archaeon]
MNYEGQSQNVDPVTAIYWVFTTMTTLGYGDIVFNSPIGQLFSIIVVFSGLAMLWAVFIPLLVTPKIESLIEAPPTSIPSKMQGHIIIVGYNSIVETLTERLSLLKIPFLIIERSDEVARKIFREYPTLWGDPAEIEVLERAFIRSARLLIANEKEELNAEVILTVREISNIEIFALVDDLARSRFLGFAGASRILSPKTLLGTFIARIASPPRKHIFPGSIPLFGGLRLVELPIYQGADIIGKRLDAECIKATGASIVGIWQKGVFMPYPDPEGVIRSNFVLMAAGDLESLTRIRDLTIGKRKEGHLIVLGYGDVGRRVSRVLCESDIHPIIVDRRELKDVKLRHVLGDATLETSLVEAGINESVAVLIMLNHDDDVIYSTLLAKNLNPDAYIIARANRAASSEKIYRAGADYVASVPIVASHLLARMIQQQEEEFQLLYKDLELTILRITKRSKLAGKSLLDIDLAASFGCRVVAIERDGQALIEIGQRVALRNGDVLALIGSPKGIESFNKVYDRKNLINRFIKLILFFLREFNR